MFLFPLVNSVIWGLRCFEAGGLLLLRSTGSRRTRVSAVAAGGPRVCRVRSDGAGLSCPAACGIFPDWGLNPRLLHWRVVSYPPGKSKSGARLVQACLHMLGLYTLSAFLRKNIRIHHSLTYQEHLTVYFSLHRVYTEILQAASCAFACL